jgi:hypothetical protein
MKLHSPRGGRPKGEVGRFYRNALASLQEAGLRFLVCGGYAFEFYTRIARRTKDIDIFVLEEDVPAILDNLAGCGYRIDISEPAWLAKAHCGEDFIDIIYNSGNSLCPVDESWFEHAIEGELLDLTVMIAPVEEIIWQKCFIMVRHRYDGADVAHFIHALGHRLDWRRLLDRFGDHWRVLLSHLVLFEYIYPGTRSVIPSWAKEELSWLAQNEWRSEMNGSADLCRGVFLSPLDFQADIAEFGYRDPREAIGRR